MSVRERQRREWREAVSRAAEALVTCRRILATKTTFSDRFYYGCNVEDAEYLLACELREPKLWTSPAPADTGKRIEQTLCAGDPEPCSACRRWSRAGRAKRREIRDGQLRGVVGSWRPEQRRHQ